MIEGNRGHHLSMTSYLRKILIQGLRGDKIRVSLAMFYETVNPGSPDGVLCNHPFPSVVHLWSVFKYLRDDLSVFFEISEVRSQSSKKK